MWDMNYSSGSQVNLGEACLAPTIRGGRFETRPYIADVRDMVVDMLTFIKFSYANDRYEKTPQGRPRTSVL